MTPKEKAIELVNNFKDLTLNVEYDDVQNNFTAKQCALITVNEILNSNPHSNPFNTNVYPTMDYWQEVKQEINKL